MHDQFLALWMDSWKDEIEYRFPMSEHVLIELPLSSGITSRLTCLNSRG